MNYTKRIYYFQSKNYEITENRKEDEGKLKTAIVFYHL